MPNPLEAAKEGLQQAGKIGGKLISEGAELADKVIPGDAELVSKAVDPIVDLLDSEEPDGTDGGSSNWAAWGHPEIREMLDTSVNPEDIYQGAEAWSEQGTEAAHIVTGLTADLNSIVTGGWHGDSAEAATASLPPISKWATDLSKAVDRTSQLIAASGGAAGQAKATVPPAVVRQRRRRPLPGRGLAAAGRPRVARGEPVGRPPPR